MFKRRAKRVLEWGSNKGSTEEGGQPTLMRRPSISPRGVLTQHSIIPNAGRPPQGAQEVAHLKLM